MPECDGTRRNGVGKPEPSRELSFGIAVILVVADLPLFHLQELWELAESTMQVRVGQAYPYALKSWLKAIWNDAGMKVINASGDEATIPER